ncbi:response regulator [Fictibacillus aquaticus]|uniref:Transcriptional regulatory protein n=1 Tax=Fictibacillus aquaticus TaxID=2021314 RepID=A0A235FES9_9BACL|nr:response regulator [Fictibacillus aquaticus]OYD59454.1 two-component system response regulator [Fictibacillus aquaticus]
MLKVVLIEDDLMVQDVNRMFVEKVDGFSVAAIASNGREGMRKIREVQPDLVIIDMYMPEQDGLETLRQIRSEGIDTDIIAITAASDMETVRLFLQNGAFDYIMKPFKFERIQQALLKYRAYREETGSSGHFTQTELDKMMFQPSQKAEKKSDEEELPKGLNGVTLNKILSYLKAQSDEVSAEEVAEGIGLARVTARRYLDHLEKTGNITIHMTYGGVGRPVNRYKIKR